MVQVSRSNGQADCIEVAFLTDTVATRDTKDRDRATLTFGRKGGSRSSGAQSRAISTATDTGLPEGPSCAPQDGAWCLRATKSPSVSEGQGPARVSTSSAHQL
ncbi:DUF397 domain-containing protein [Streptomyces albus]|uniref:DUF397 domain-containing protein n=1 Tax=Streptomyces albus TaxID=1888 RepID=UPI003D69F756